MNQQTSSPQADLQAAEDAMRDAIRTPDAITTPDAGSLDRMLVHVINMREAISSSPERHVNVVKRLNDFALTTNRMMSRHPGATPQLARVSEALRTASQSLQASFG